MRHADQQYRASVYVDGFNQREIEKFELSLKDLRIRKRKVQGVRKEENNAFIRLVDAICGLIRDNKEGQPWASVMVRKFTKKKILIPL